MILRRVFDFKRSCISDILHPMRIEEMIDGLDVVQGGFINMGTFLEKVGEPHHVHCDLKDLPKAVRRDLVLMYRDGKTDEELNLRCGQWAELQGLKAVRAGIDFESGGVITFEHQKDPSSGQTWPIDAVLKYPKIDILIERDYPYPFRIFVNTNWVHEAIFQADIPGGYRGKPTEQRIRERIPFSLQRGIEIPDRARLIVGAFQNSMVEKEV